MSTVLQTGSTAMARIFEWCCNLLLPRLSVSKTDESLFIRESVGSIRHLHRPFISSRYFVIRVGVSVCVEDVCKFVVGGSCIIYDFC